VLSTRRKVHSDGRGRHRLTLCCPSRAHCASAVHERAPAITPVIANIKIACSQ